MRYLYGMHSFLRLIRSPWIFISLASLVLLGGYCTALQTTAAPPPPPVTHNASSIDGQHNGTWYYGVYLNQHKVGWMKNSIDRQGKQVTLSTHLHAKIGGLGQVKTLELDEVRTYNKNDKHLEKVVFSQATQGAHLKVQARAQGKELEIAIHSGGKISKQRLPNASKTKRTRTTAVHNNNIMC